MSSSLSICSLYSPSNPRFLYHHPFKLTSQPYPFRIVQGFHETRSLSSSVSERMAEFSWFPEEDDDFNGWALVEAPVRAKEKGFPTFIMICAGASLAALLGALAYFSLSRRGFEFRISSPLGALQGFLVSSRKDESSESSSNESYEVEEVDEVLQESKGIVYDEVDKGGAEDASIRMEQDGYARIRIPMTADSTQQEALVILKKLNIIEDEVKPDELCTRREYARWFVRANSQLERNRRHRIISPVELSGTTDGAFSDIDIWDPDFCFIQSLAEAGIVQSKLSGGRFTADLDESEQGVNFFPERFISRQDLISWKAKLEHNVMEEVNSEVLRKSIAFLDRRDIDSEVLMDLYMDNLAGEKSIVRRVFGQCKRLQPHKPCTKAQVAVALMSGRMAQLIHAEVSRLESENCSRRIAMEEIKMELLDRGDIIRYWAHKIEEERNRGLEVERAYLAVVHDLEQEKNSQECALSELLKQRAALDCQKQLLSSLKEEVDEMSQRLELERSQYINEQQSLKHEVNEVQAEYDRSVDAKTILEAEVEALRTLRSWIEDEARKNQARAKVFEEASRRWKWDG